GGDIQLTWAEDCAYLVVPKGGAGSDGIGVVRVNPATGQPDEETMKVIRLPQWKGKGGTLGIHEGVHANEVAHILVVPIGTMISVFDISADCADPQWSFDMNDDSVDTDPTHSEAVGAAGI